MDLRAKLDTQQINNLILQFLSSNPQAKALNDDIIHTNADIQALRDRLYAEHQFSPAQYDIDNMTGEFVPLAK